jgi:hypothetical protein
LVIHGSMRACKKSAACAPCRYFYFTRLLPLVCAANSSEGDRRANTFAYDIPGNLIAPPEGDASSSAAVRRLRPQSKM